jgi:serine O-acetyltransferase
MEAKQHKGEAGGSAKDVRLCQPGDTDVAGLWNRIRGDARQVAEGEPQLRSLLEDVVLDQPCLGASLGVRLARKLAREDMTREELGPLLAGDIHPAARIGCGILLDHATSFVVGETAIIEDNVSILHEVTLGGSGKQTGLRHPIVRSGVLLGAGAKILGRVEIGEGAKVGAGSVVLNDVAPHTTVAGVPAQVVGVSREDAPALEMDQQLGCRVRLSPESPG